MLTVLGIDPGGKGGDTGIVLIGYGEDEPAHEIDSWAVKNDLPGFVGWFKGAKPYADTVVCEHFVNRNVRGADLTPCFVEGAVRALYTGVTPVVLSGAGGKNTAVSDKALKNLGLYFPGDHHRDRTEAARHAVWWLKRQRHVPTLKKMEGTW